MAGELLRVISGAASGLEVELNHELLVGREASAPGDLGGDGEISRRHAIFRRRDDGTVVVEDLGSRNGTFVNGKRVEEPTVLSPGDEVRFGKTRVRFDGQLPGGDQQTRARNAVVSPPPTKQVAAPPPRTPPGASLPKAGGPISGPPKAVTKSGPRLVIDAVVVLVIALVIAAISLLGDKNESVAPSCGNANGSGPIAFVSYVLAKGDGESSSALAIPHSAGDLKPLAISRCTVAAPQAGQRAPLFAVGRAQTTPDGRRLYVARAGTNHVLAFDVADAAKPRRVQDLALAGSGEVRNLQLDPSGRYLVALSTPPGQPAVEHVIRLADDGHLGEVASAKLPGAAEPYALAVTKPRP